MYHTTGFTKDEIVDLFGQIYVNYGNQEKKPWPPILRLYNSVVVTLTYLRRNYVQAEIGETFSVSQSTHI